MLLLKVSGGVFMLFVAASASPGHAARNITCPSGTHALPAGCVLDSDVVLDEPIELESFATLNCRGHRLLPFRRGSGTTQDTYVPSVPPLAIAITGDRAVTVKNCVIGEEDKRFDFGVIAINSKNPDRDGHRIRNNEIHARDSAVILLRVDDAHVSDNVISWTNGSGVSVRRDSDRNRITNNLLWSPGLPTMPARLVPDGPFLSVADDGVQLAGGFTVAHVLYNLVIDGRLFQFPNFEDGQYRSLDDNVVELNRLSLPGSSTGKSHAAILVAGNTFRSRVVGNTVDQAGVGVRLAGMMAAQPVRRAAQCVAPAGQTVDRYCETSADCFVPGIDAAPLGICPALVQDVIDWRARHTFVESNTLIGPFNSTVLLQRAGIAGGAGTVGGVLRSNQIIGTGAEAGITLLGNMLETAVVTRNVVHGASFGLLLQSGTASRFGARVFLNDITGSTLAVGVAGPYAFPTELSSNGEGNYWGHVVPPCFGTSDSPIPALIWDSNPSCEPVATSATKEGSSDVFAAGPRSSWRLGLDVKEELRRTARLTPATRALPAAMRTPVADRPSGREVPSLKRRSGRTRFEYRP